MHSTCSYEVMVLIFLSMCIVTFVIDLYQVNNNEFLLHFIMLLVLSGCNTLLAHLSLRSSVLLSIPYRLVTRKQRNAEQLKLGIDISYSTSKWNANFQFKRSTVKVTGRKNLQNLASTLLAGSSVCVSSAAVTTAH